jgi:hypothetical protein
VIYSFSTKRRKQRDLSVCMSKYLDLEVVRLLVFALGHVNGDELEVDIFLKETG